MKVGWMGVVRTGERAHAVVTSWRMAALVTAVASAELLGIKSPGQVRTSKEGLGWGSGGCNFKR